MINKCKLAKLYCQGQGGGVVVRLAKGAGSHSASASASDCYWELQECACVRVSVCVFVWILTLLCSYVSVCSVYVCLCVCVRLVRALKCNKRGSKVTPAADRPGSRLLISPLPLPGSGSELSTQNSWCSKPRNSSNTNTHTHSATRIHMYICMGTYTCIYMLVLTLVCVCVWLHSINVVSKTKSAAACGKWHVVACSNLQPEGIPILILMWLSINNKLW